MGCAVFTAQGRAATVAECKQALTAEPDGVDCTVTGVATTRSDFIASGRARFFVEDQTGAVLAHLRRSKLPNPIRPGDRVTVGGEFYIANDGEFELRVDELTRLGPGPPPRPRDVGLSEAQTGCCPGEFVRVQGSVRDMIVSSDRIVVLLGEDLLRVYWMPGKGEEFPAGVQRYERGAHLQVIGINRPHNEGSGDLRYQIRLRSLGDAVILHSPPPLSPEQMRLLVVLATIAALLAASWIFLLRRAVRVKTAHIQQLVDNLEQTVAQRTSALEESNRRLSAARDAAEEANKAKSNFLANISHELRSPMQLVSGYAELLLDDAQLDSSERRKLETILGSSRGLVRIVDDLLDISKIGADKLELEAAEFDPLDLTRCTVDSFEEPAARKRLALLFSPAPGVPATVVGDAVRLRQVLVNLLDNAVRFTQAGEIEVSVRIAAVDGSPQSFELHFVVRDTGIGIPADRVEHVFEPFTQADSSTTREYGGTGLGLAVCRGLVKSMGGDISIDSTTGVGTTVRFHITAKAATGIATEDPDARRHIEPKHAEEDGPRVLVVDDMAELRELLGELLERGGYRPMLAGSGREAIERWRDQAPDLILMDIQMPGMSGVDAVREIRRREGEERTPILALTANAAHDQLEHYLDAGMDSYITKPITRIENLYETIDQCLAAAKARTTRADKPKAARV